MAQQYPPKKNDAAGYTFYLSLVSQANTKIFQANPTLAAGDAVLAVDDAVPANLTTLPVVDADFTKRVKVVLSQAETNGDNLTLVLSDVAGAEWCDVTINLQTVADRQTGDSFARLGAPVGVSVSADVLVIDNLVDDLEARLTAVRAGYLDNINNATLAAAVFPVDPADQSLVIAATDAIIADTNDIQARLPAALTAAGHMKADALALDGSTGAATDLKTSALTIVRAAAIAGTLLSRASRPSNSAAVGGEPDHSSSMVMRVSRWAKAL